jgi:hypothetical protein
VPIERKPMLRLVAALIAAVIWFALVLQFFLSLKTAGERGIVFGIAMYLAFFTVLTNLIVAVVLTMPLLSPQSRFGRFCERHETVAGVAVNIALVGITYNLLLRNVWDPQGWQLVADILLHQVVPIVFVVYAWLLARERVPSYSSRVRWAIWPVLYFVYALVRGAMTGFYPYPFMDVGTIGYLRVFENAIGLVIAYFAIAAVLYGFDKIPSRHRRLD